MSKRSTFKLSCIYSSRGDYVRKAHIRYIQQWHKENESAIVELSATLEIKPKYYVKCFGVIKEITKEKAKELGDLIICKQ